MNYLCREDLCGAEEEKVTFRVGHKNGSTPSIGQVLLCQSGSPPAKVKIEKVIIGNAEN